MRFRNGLVMDIVMMKITTRTANLMVETVVDLTSTLNFVLNANVLEAKVEQPELEQPSLL